MNLNSMRMLDSDDETGDAEVTWEDQQRINAFSKLNTRIRHMEDRLQDLKEEKDALDDLSTELELGDEDELVLYKVGETFLHIPHASALSRLEKEQAEIDEQVRTLSASCDECEREMKELKVALYAKFGKAINLDE